MNRPRLHDAALVSGPLSHGEGPRVAVKEVFDQAGQVTTACSPALADAPPAVVDSALVARLRDADCAIIGRANMHELAYGVTGVNAWTGTPVNPLYPDLIPGGSSSGSAAAVAADLADFAIGSDTGGSIRMPAACCGVVGLKPTFGRVSRQGAIPAASSLDCAGPFARDVATIERAMAIIAPDWHSAGTAQAAGPTGIGWVIGNADPDLAAVAERAAAALGTLKAVSLPGMGAAMAAGLILIGFENWQAFGHLTKSGKLGADVQERLVKAAAITTEDAAMAEATRQAFTAEVDAALDRFAVLALPTLPRPVPTLSEATDPAAIVPLTANVRPFNLSGHPAIALPVGEVGGRPVSLQLVGRKGGDEALCALARRIDLYRKGDA